MLLDAVSFCPPPAPLPPPGEPHAGPPRQELAPDATCPLPLKTLLTLMRAPRAAGLLVHDAKLLLLRFAFEESFSTYSRGGGRESNMKLLPFILQMATHLLDVPASPQRAAYGRALNTFLAQSKTARAGADGVLCARRPAHAPRPSPPSRRRRAAGACLGSRDRQAW